MINLTRYIDWVFGTLLRCQVSRFHVVERQVEIGDGLVFPEFLVKTINYLKIQTKKFFLTRCHCYGMKRSCEWIFSGRHSAIELVRPLLIYLVK